MFLSLASAIVVAWPLVLVALLAICLSVLPTLRRIFAFCYRREVPRDWWDRVALRYVKLGTHPWSFAWFKLRMDPMFRELPELVKSGLPFRRVLDLGCGYGFAACSHTGVERPSHPLRHRPRPRPCARCQCSLQGARPGRGGRGLLDFLVPGLPECFDGIFVLDVIHFIPDAALALTLARIRARLDVGGRLIIRSIVRPTKGPGAGGSGGSGGSGGAGASGGSLLWRLAAVRASSPAIIRRTTAHWRRSVRPSPPPDSRSPDARCLAQAPRCSGSSRWKPPEPR